MGLQFNDRRSSGFMAWIPGGVATVRVWTPHALFGMDRRDVQYSGFAMVDA